MIFVSCFSPQGRYPALVQQLADSLIRFGLPLNISAIPAGDWINVIKCKPRALWHVLLKSREPVCWIDADCEIKALPALLLNTSRDFACYNWHADPENIGWEQDSTRLEASSGVVMFGYTAPAMELLWEWQSACKEYPKDSDDKCLSIAFNQWKPPVRPLWLPKAYNRMDSMWPHIEPVIDHHYGGGTHGQGPKAAA